MNVKNNKRSKDTEAKVEKVFLDTLSQKHVSGITVSELCKGAGITRTSFYGHYQDVYDLQDKVQQKMTSQALQIFEEEWHKNDGDPHTALVRTFQYIEENKEFFRYFLNNADMKAMFSSGQVSGMFGPNLSKQEMMYLTFYIGGINALLLDWIERGCPEKPQELLEALPDRYVRMR